MATACKIGMVKDNGTVECVICWRDGQPDAAGEILTSCYETYDKVEKEEHLLNEEIENIIRSKADLLKEMKKYGWCKGE